MEYDPEVRTRLMKERKEREAEYVKYIAVGPHCWGSGKTVFEAVNNCHKSYGKGNWHSPLFAKQISVSLCVIETVVDDMGAVSYPWHKPPIRIAYGKELEE